MIALSEWISITGVFMVPICHAERRYELIRYDRDALFVYYCCVFDHFVAFLRFRVIGTDQARFSTFGCGWVSVVSSTLGFRGVEGRTF